MSLPRSGYGATRANGVATTTKPTHWRARAEAMRAAVEARFWVEDLGFYALALDGDGEPCSVRTSNAGHLLFVGLPHARAGAGASRDQLLAPSFNSGWGIRTLAEEAALQPDVVPQRLDLAA